MQEFKINADISIECESQKTRSGFRHLATLLLNGIEREKVKCCYQNRTWEQYEFQSVIHKLLAQSKILNDQEKQQARSKLDGSDGYNGEGNEVAMRPLKNIAMVAKLGEVFNAGNPKAINDWKARMLTAGLNSLGLDMPEDWAGLDEATKEARLNAVIGELAK